MRPNAPALAIAVCTLAALSACKRRPEDEAAKKRMFSPEEPVGVAAEAREPLDAQRLADDPGLARRVLRMPRGEIQARLGPHKAQTRVQFAWTRGAGAPDGGAVPEVSVSEETALVAGSGNDFSVRLSNDHNQGFELVWTGGEVFVRSLFGAFHQRRTDRTDVQRVREQAVSALPTFDRLARGLKLRLVGAGSSGGRRAVRYAVEGFGARPDETKDARALPRIVYPEQAGGKAGPDPDTARRLELWEREQPASVSGTLSVDAETAAPLACDLQGRFQVPGKAGAPSAALELHSVLTTQEVGKDPGLKAPAAEPLPSTPHVVKDPLRFLGKGVAGAPGAPSTEEGEADDSSDDSE